MKRIIPIIVIVLNSTMTKAQTWSAAGSGMNQPVLSLSVYNSQLYAGGWFTTAGGSPASKIAKWNGTSWSAIGTGMDLGFVGALTVFNGQLYAGGNFSTAGGLLTGGIARTNGISWDSLNPNVVDAWVYSSGVYNGELYVGGGIFCFCSNQHIAKWNGAAWTIFGAWSTDDDVYAMAVYNGELYTGGFFTMSGPLATNYISRWNGTSWNNVGTGMDGPIKIGRAHV